LKAGINPFFVSRLLQILGNMGIFSASFAPGHD